MPVSMYGYAPLRRNKETGAPVILHDEIKSTPECCLRVVKDVARRIPAWDSNYPLDRKSTRLNSSH